MKKGQRVTHSIYGAGKYVGPATGPGFVYVRLDKPVQVGGKTRNVLAFSARLLRWL